jgi:hypothetical protein
MVGRDNSLAPERVVGNRHMELNTKSTEKFAFHINLTQSRQDSGNGMRTVQTPLFFGWMRTGY